MKQTTPVSYTVLKDELDGVLSRLQSEDLDIDEAVQLYKRGNELIAEVGTYLKSAQNIVKKLQTGFEKTSQE